ncbi:MAG: ATP-binding protein [Gemmatimonadetes bacterium]|nr:MAG: ATP-binding protein [Gemmatimonadota bacterium]
MNLRLDVTPDSMKLDVPSDLGMVGDAVELVATHLPPGTLSPRRISFNLRTALAEALGNAIRYGNGEDPDRFVRVYVELGGDFVRIHVDDDGHGFDSSRVPDPTHPDNLEREYGRGLFVIRHLVDDVAFNEKGNGICLTLRAG